MYKNSPAERVMQRINKGLTAKAVESEKVLDACGDKKPKGDYKEQAPIMDAAADYAAKDIAVDAIATLQQFAETSEDDLDDGEDLADRLAAMFIGIADANIDGEIGEDEQAVLDEALNAAWDYLLSKGAEEGDLDCLFNDWDNDAAKAIHTLLVTKLPDGDQAASDDADTFIFGDGSDESAFDAVYKKRAVIRGGKKTWIRKRISGHVRLSAKQKVSIKKAGLKSQNAAAKMRRAKSMRLRGKMGLK